MCAAIAVSPVPKNCYIAKYFSKTDKKPQVQTVAVHLPVRCVATNNIRVESWSEKRWIYSTTKQYRTARLKHGDKYIVYRLHDLQNLLGILYLAHEQQKFFLEALTDILDYATIALTSCD
jgi:hypothetical protein